MLADTLLMLTEESPSPATKFDFSQGGPVTSRDSDPEVLYRALPSSPSFSSSASDAAASDASAETDSGLEDCCEAVRVFARRRIDLSGGFGQDDAWLQRGHRQFKGPWVSSHIRFTSGNQGDASLWA